MKIIDKENSLIYDQVTWNNLEINLFANLAMCIQGSQYFTLKYKIDRYKSLIMTNLSFYICIYITFAFLAPRSLARINSERFPALKTLTEVGRRAAYSSSFLPKKSRSEASSTNIISLIKGCGDLLIVKVKFRFGNLGSKFHL